MAFVYRSPRETSIEPHQSTQRTETINDVAESTNDRSLAINPFFNKMHPKNRIEIPFNTTSTRPDINGPINTQPGPGTYNISREISIANPFNEKVGFLTNSKRFKTSTNLNNVPGPGEYATLSTFGISTSSSKNEPNHIFKRPEIKFNSDDRVLSIPDKAHYGYEFINGKRSYLKNPDIKETLSGEKTDSAGPGEYNISSSWNKNVIKWKQEKNKRRTNPIETLLNSASRNSLTTVNSNHNNQSTINKSTHGNLNKSLTTIGGNKRTNRSIDAKDRSIMSNSERGLLSKNLMFTQTLLKRKKYSDSLKERNSNPNVIEELRFTDDPGPGFYLSNENSSPYQRKAFVTSGNFGSNSPKFFTLKSLKSNVGPGEYFKQKNKYDNEIENKRKANIVPRYDYNSLKMPTEEKEPIYLQTLKEGKKIINLGPGEYDVEQPLIKKEVSKISQFGSMEERFKEAPKEEGPAPTKYNPKLADKVKEKFKKVIGKEDKEIYEKNIEGKVSDQRLKIQKSEVPPVGTYNPEVVKSIQYEIWSKKNYYQGKLIPFNGHGARFKSNTKPLMSVGPGSYDPVPSLTQVGQSFSPFGNHGNRFRNKIKNSDVPAPGYYNQTGKFDWNKKTFNVLFV